MFADRRAIDDDLFEPLEIRQLQSTVYERVFGAANPVEIGRYRVLERIGAGGMGVVYSAYDPELDRRVAVKLVRRSSERARVRLQREARSMAQLSHPNVVQLHDVGEWKGRVFIAMELVEGDTLTRWLSRECPTQAGVLEMLREAGQGLRAAHAAGLVHRDFKPDNVLIGPDARPRVTDFGLAQIEMTVGEGVFAPTMAGLTETGAAMGTPAYMAPEQLQGRPVDARVDQFAFGIVLYEALFGERPFVGRDFETLRHSVLTGDRRPMPRKAPANVRRVLERALARDPEARYPSMGALLAELAPRRRRWWIPGAAAIAAAFALGSTALGTTRGQQAEARAPVVAAPEPPVSVDRLAHARALLSTDTTGALQTLRSLPADAWTADAKAIAAEATVRGFAHRVAPSVDANEYAEQSGVFLATSFRGPTQVVDAVTGRAHPFASAVQVRADGRLLLEVKDESIVMAAADDPSRTHVHVLAQPLELHAVIDAPNGEALAVLTPDLATIVDPATGATTGTLPTPGREPSGAVALSPDASTVVGVTRDQRLVAWTAEGQTTLLDHAYGDVRYSVDGRRLAARLDEDTVAVWRTNGSTIVGDAERFDDVERYVLSPTGDAIVLVSPRWKGQVAIRWFSPALKVELDLDARPNHMQMSADGTTLAAFVGKQATVWDTRTGARMQPAWPHPIIGLHLDDETREVITLDNRGQRATWRLPWADWRVIETDCESVRALAFRGSEIFVGARDGVVHRWRSESEHADRFAVLDVPVIDLATAGSRVAVYGSESGRTVIKMLDGERELLEHTMSVSQGVALHPESLMIRYIRDGNLVQHDLVSDAIDTELVTAPADFDDRLATVFGPLTVRRRDGGRYEVIPRPDVERPPSAADLEFPVVERTTPEGPMLVGSLGDGAGWWQPGLSEPMPLTPGLYGRLELSDDVTEVAMTVEGGGVVRFAHPLHAWAEPQATLATLLPEAEAG